MKIAVPKQSRQGETRVPVVPAVIKKLTGLGVTVLVESGAGVGAHHSDSDYEQAGASILREADSAWSQGEVVVAIHPPTPDQAAAMPEGCVLVGMLAPLKNPQIVKALAQRKVTSFSLEFMPRITRAQPMDVLSSQANVSGYVSAVLGAEACPKMFPMMITAAGTIAPARVFVLGAGVAGLQAIATAKRLGAVVEAYDVRPVVREQVLSVGGRFIELPTTRPDAQTTGGYAKQQSEEDRKRQVELMAKHVSAADVVIATAAVFGKEPPLLIPQDVVNQMKPGSVIVDIAADAAAGRGNCAATKPGERYTTDSGVVIEGSANLPARVPVHSSQLLANNVFAFLKEILPGEGWLKLDLEDEIQKAVLITHQGNVVHTLVLGAVSG